MNYEESLLYIHSAPKIAKIPGNEALRKILAKFGNPQNKLKFIHIAGTNGKGSVAAMLNSCLVSSGLKTGMFTSPFIEVFNERIQIDSNLIPDEKISYYTNVLKDIMDECDTYLSEFALIFVIAMLYFTDEKCDIVVLETGLGGRLDATNVIEKSLVSVITKIGMDHMEYLGDSIDKIAGEKCGIIKKDGMVVVYPEQDETVFDVVKLYTEKNNARLIIPDNNTEYKLSLKGEYQKLNAAVVIEVLDVLRNSGYDIKERDIVHGLSNTKWPGRFELIAENLLLDGCHNEDGAKAFAESIKALDKKITVVTCVMKDKEYDKIAKILSGIANEIVLTRLETERTVNTDDYLECYKKYGKIPIIIDDPLKAVEYGMGRDGICAVCGSLYLVGEIRKFYNKASS